VTLRLTNTLTRRVEEFQPLEPGKVSIYCCGVTVYDLCHLGHARSYIAWDVLRRYLIWSDYAVTFVQNYTDIDDKILNRAAEEGSSMEAVSERNIDAFVADMARLNILPADRMPRATRSLDAIRALISELEVFRRDETRRLRQAQRPRSGATARQRRRPCGLGGRGPQATPL
jgi:cysteinyl-tRNA synthetase